MSESRQDAKPLLLAPRGAPSAGSATASAPVTAPAKASPYGGNGAAGKTYAQLHAEATRVLDESRGLLGIDIDPNRLKPRLVGLLRERRYDLVVKIFEVAPVSKTADIGAEILAETPEQEIRRWQQDPAGQRVLSSIRLAFNKDHQLALGVGKLLGLIDRDKSSVRESAAKPEDSRVVHRTLARTVTTAAPVGGSAALAETQAGSAHQPDSAKQAEPPAPPPELAEFPAERLRLGSELTDEYADHPDELGALLANTPPQGPWVLRSVRYGGVVTRSGAPTRGPFLVFLRGGEIRRFVPIQDVPRGAWRTDGWWIQFDGSTLRRAQRYPEHIDAVQRQLTPRQERELDSRDLVRRASAGAELNRDIEALLERGMALDDALAATRRLHNDLLRQLGFAYAQAFQSYLMFEQLRPAVMDPGRLLGEAAYRATSTGDGSLVPPSRPPGDTTVAHGARLDPAGRNVLTIDREHPSAPPSRSSQPYAVTVASSPPGRVPPGAFHDATGHPPRSTGVTRLHSDVATSGLRLLVAEHALLKAQKLGIAAAEQKQAVIDARAAVEQSRARVERVRLISSGESTFGKDVQVNVIYGPGGSMLELPSVRLHDPKGTRVSMLIPIDPIEPVNGHVHAGGDEPNVTNLNPINPNSGGPQLNIRNHIKAGIEHMDIVFRPESVRELSGTKLWYRDINWDIAAKSAYKAMAPGARFELNVWSNPRELNALIKAFEDAKFKDVSNSSTFKGVTVPSSTGVGSFIQGVK